ncbi:hypothetical protein B0T25DRAFT_571943 [Lasiosphaeria hispida]|uniref:Uncharacterized protein n=1 Tax=Lasiosphaeria hispida TaxID=260671 RepID=A0AAJ0HC74_9PEZI|nr:hypothetical protein B0T25DRAFT_571943 [Lasiosphaeria hispida]
MLVSTATATTASSPTIATGTSTAANATTSTGALTPATTPNLKIHNICTFPVYVYILNNGSCDKGTNNARYDQTGEVPYTIHMNETTPFNYIKNNYTGTSVKISRNGIASRLPPQWHPSVRVLLD